MTVSFKQRGQAPNSTHVRCVTDHSVSEFTGLFIYIYKSMTQNQMYSLSFIMKQMSGRKGQNAGQTNGLNSQQALVSVCVCARVLQQEF